MVRPILPIRLTKDQIETIQIMGKSFSETGRHRWADRCRVILLRSEGYGLEETNGIVKRPLSTIKDWNRAFWKNGIRSLTPMTSTRGRKKKLDSHERMLLAKSIERGPIAAGYQGNVWTSPMVCDYISKRWNVEYHPGHVRKLLHQLGFSVQFPREKLALADQAAQDRWLKKIYPQLKKKPGQKGPSSSSRTRPISNRKGRQGKAGPVVERDSRSIVIHANGRASSTVRSP